MTGTRKRGGAAKAAALALTAVLGAAGFAGCEREERIEGHAEPLTVVLDWVINPDHVGIYVARAEGFFEDAGLDVELRVPSDPAAPVKQVAAGQADLAVTYEPEVLIARDQGLDVKAVAAIAQEPLTSLVSLEGKVERAEQLPGSRVATAGIPYQEAYLKAILMDQGEDLGAIEKVDVGFNLQPALLGGKVDAVLGMFKNIEGVDLAERGRKPTIVPVDRLGIPTYDELVLVARDSELEADPEPVELFLGALERGTQVAQRDPAAATKALLDASDDLDPKLTRAQVEATLPLLRPAADRPFGYMEPSEWREFAGFFADMGQTKRRLSADELLTNEHLPGALE